MMHPVVLRGGRPAFASVLVLLLLIFHPAMARAATHLPTLSGTPPTTVQAGPRYAFQPTATDANGEKFPLPSPVRQTLNKRHKSA